MIEAREEQQAILRKTKNDLNGVEFVIALLGGDNAKAVTFHSNSSGSSIYPERSDAIKIQQALPMRRLDDIIKESAFSMPPYFLKLDIQGGELQCLRGGLSTLAEAEVVQLEIALLNYNEGAPGAAQVVAFMEAHGFSIFDVAGFIRPNGVNLVQIDVIFVAKDLKLRPDYFRFNL